MLSRFVVSDIHISFALYDGVNPTRSGDITFGSIYNISPVSLSMMQSSLLQEVEVLSNQINVHC